MQLFIDKHLRFIKYCLYSLPENCAYLETSRMTILFFSIASIRMLDKLDSINDMKDEIIQWIMSLRIMSDSKGINNKYCGFTGSNYLRTSDEETQCKIQKGDSDYVRIKCKDPGILFSDENSCSHITMTLSALLSLVILCDNKKITRDTNDNKEQDDYDVINYLNKNLKQLLPSLIAPPSNARINGADLLDKEAILVGLSNLQNIDGSFRPTVHEGESDLRFVYCASAICHLLDDWSHIDASQMISFIMSCKSYEGGFGQVPGAESHGGSTFCAVASLKLAGKLHLITDNQEIKENLLRWCMFRQQQCQSLNANSDIILCSGFNGRPNKDADSCYSFWIGSTLKILGCLSHINVEANQTFLLNVSQDLRKGGFKKAINVYSDPLHTFLSLSALTMFSHLQDSKYLSPSLAQLTDIQPALMLPF
ncbi:unnamed protein product [Gordionus sp. m RMFG-2023]|uniref:geranylgeranyl transferase type-1 subunit beta-like isoform X1 n=1 Tax=Gordionus sp. m RMFG-2023 TaxID=3053472 RepID=UPI0030E1881F